MEYLKEACPISYLDCLREQFDFTFVFCIHVPTAEAPKSSSPFRNFNVYKNYLIFVFHIHVCRTRAQMSADPFWGPLLAKCHSQSPAWFEVLAYYLFAVSTWMYNTKIKLNGYLRQSKMGPKGNSQDPAYINFLITNSLHKSQNGPLLAHFLVAHEIYNPFIVATMSKNRRYFVRFSN